MGLGIEKPLEVFFVKEETDENIFFSNFGANLKLRCKGNLKKEK